MDRNPAPGLRPVLLLALVSASAAGLHGTPVTGNLRCVSDYLFTINCSLTLPPSGNTSYWLRLQETSLDEETLLCNLTHARGVSSCSVRRPSEDVADMFSDMNGFEISLCREHEETCDVLDEEFRPAANIKPNAPCCLAVAHNASQHRFSWRSTYEQCAGLTGLVDSFQYQLHYYHTGDHRMAHNVTSNSPECSVGDEVFEPGSEYAARVRSSPNQVSYWGQWSDWSAEVRWQTEPDSPDPSTKTFVSDLGKKVFIAFCLMVPLVFLVCYAPVRKWKQSVFIPTPAPYFHSLYSDCHGDFRTWVITQGHTADTLKAEETLRIDTLTQSPDESKEACRAPWSYQLMGGSGYSNISDQISEVSLGAAYAVGNVESSLRSRTFYVEAGSPAEGDSGCWLCSDTSLEKEPPWYCNDYCTLSAFQQPTPVAAEHPGSSSTQGLITAQDCRDA